MVTKKTKTKTKKTVTKKVSIPKGTDRTLIVNGTPVAFFSHEDISGRKKTGRKKTVDRSKTYKQKPVPGTNRLMDLVTPALPPGWRISERTGKPYFENRENRSDTAEEIAVFVPKAKKPKTAKKATAKKAAPKKTTAPMAVIYGPYLTGDTGYALKKGTGQWEGYWCIRWGSRKNNKSPFVWSSSEAVTMGHIPMDRGETAALQYLAEVAKRKGWKQMYPKKPATPKKKPEVKPKAVSPKKRAAPKKAKPRQKGQAKLF